MRAWSRGLAGLAALGLGACAGAAGGADVDAGRGQLSDAAQQDDPDPAAPDAASKPDAQPEPDASPPDAPPPPPVDATPGTPDAAPRPDAAPCTPTTRNLLMNAGFDSGAGGGWSETSSKGYELIVSADGLPPQHEPHAGEFAGFLGGYDADDYGTATDRLLQSITIPPSATSLQLKGFRWIETEEAVSDGAFDDLFIELLPATGTNVIEDFGGSPSFSNVDVVADWTAFTLSAGQTHAGQSVRLSIRARVDYSLKTNFFVDSLVLEATVCE